MLGLYRLLTFLLYPCLRMALSYRLRRGKEDPQRISERRGFSPLARPAGRLLWIHAASVGEAMAALPLVHSAPDHCQKLTVLLTTGTRTAAQMMAEQLPSGALHCFSPVDHPCWTRRFLDHWQPDVAVWIESELWPNLVLDTHRRDIPMLLVNARVSARSRRRWRPFGRSLAQLLGCFRMVLVQSPEDACFYQAAGARQAHYAGNLKQIGPALPADPEELARLRAAIGERRLWLAASTHRGEEAAALQAHRTISANCPDLLTIIAPRHPERGAEVAALAQGYGLRVMRRGGKAGPPPEADVDVYIADSLGELGLFYRLAGLAFIGGSLPGKIGGHNPVEAARLDCAILHGPDMANFSQVAREMAAASAAIQVADNRELAMRVGALMGNPALAATYRRAAARYAAGQRHEILAQLLAEIQSCLASSAP